jgi:hypothetical protein
MMHENENPTGIPRRLLAFYREDTVDTNTVCCWVIKSRDSAKNLDLNDQPWSGRPVMATHTLNRQKFDKLIQKN